MILRKPSKIPGNFARREISVRDFFMLAEKRIKTMTMQTQAVLNFEKIVKEQAEKTQINTWCADFATCEFFQDLAKKDKLKDLPDPFQLSDFELFTLKSELMLYFTNKRKNYEDVWETHQKGLI